MLYAEGDSIQVKATDLEVMLFREVKATVTEATPVCVNARALKDYIGKAPKGAVVSLETVTELYKGLRVSSSMASVTLATQDPEDYPLAPHDIQWANAISLDPNAISLKQIAKFASPPDEGRVVLKCVLIEVYPGGQYRLTAADGFRLVNTNAISGDKIAEYLLPAKAAQVIASLKTKGTLRFGSHKYDDSDNGATIDYAEFSTDDSKVVSKLEEGKFPDYRQIIPASDRGTWVQFDTEAFRNVLESFVPISKERSSFTKLELTKGKVVLSAQDAYQNNEKMAEAELAVDWTGDDFAIGFNAKYMLDCLALCGEQTRVMLENASRPLLIEGNGCLMVVMPMHIKG
jgi:DNA polymerase-3 subunit beta